MITSPNTVALSAKKTPLPNLGDLPLTVFTSAIDFIFKDKRMA